MKVIGVKSSPAAMRTRLESVHLNSLRAQAVDDGGGR